MALEYANVVRPYIYRMLDLEHIQLENQNEFDSLVTALPGEIEENYGYYLTSLEKPWPFFVGVPVEEDGKMSVQWDVSYDLDGEEIRYNFILAKDISLTDVVYKEDNLFLPEASFATLSPGVYYMRVQATNASGYTQDCFDYISLSQEEKHMV